MVFKIMLYFGRITGFGIFPMVRVWNQPKTESYTMYYDGMVRVESNDGGLDIVPVAYISEELLEQFCEELGDG